MAEPLLVAAAAPMLLFSRSYLPWIGLGLLVLGWLIRGLASGRWLTRTPIDRPILIIFLMTFVSLYPSVDLTLSLPKFYGILLCFFVYYATVSNVHKQRGFWLGAGLLLASVVGISLVGLVGTEWNTGKYPILERAYGLAPRLIKGIQSSLGPIAGIHPNELGGTLAFLLPLPMALLVNRGVPRRSHTLLLIVILALVTLLGLGVLLMTASRSAFVGLALAMVALLLWHWRRLGSGLLLAALVALGFTLSRDAPGVAEFLLKVDVSTVASSGGTLASRMEVWDRARYMIEDFPFTGIGLNTFPIVLDTLYPSFLAGPEASIPHAHNIYLQTAVDLGLGGLLGFVGLWACVAHTGWRAYRRVDSSMRAAVIGLLLGLLAYLMYGLTDAITLGAKPVVLLWLMMGLIVSAERLGLEESALDTSAPRPSSAESSLGRAVSLALTTARDTYWIIAFFLVGMGYLVVGLGISGWVP